MLKKRLLLIVAGGVFLLLNVATATPLPEDVELAYDDGEPDGGVLLAPGQIAAVRMSPPPGTWKLKTAGYYLYQGEGKVRLFDDDSGSPGSDLIEGFSILADEGPGWYNADLEPYNIMVEGEFYVGIEGVDPFLNCSIGHDFLSGGNGRAWTYNPGFDWVFAPELTYFIRAVVTDEVGVEEELVPEPLITLQCSPNPFSNSTKISYTVPQAGRVTVSIWDASGRCVRILTDTNEAEGNHFLRWDGADDAGTALPTGVYFTRININRSTLTQKVVLVR